ncbi:DJ-1 family glyoxalase III [Carboxylicivirga linearis]|uniref:DJ-1/PfpI family protein n=1 Tax=Carboxylicivirga linearis TaxID=1628157 RepID=A0ABS5K1L5_9BACT|nr:DJ-1 family glyoxalase III [Carboxylicivirga linearis]MBS2101052.1 DJ-1/PfpI family protein [Carboxylicivirga linearis]
MEHVALFLADGFEEIEALTPVDVLRRADIKVSTISISNSLEVTGSHQIVVKADKAFDDVNFDDFTCAVLPGGIPGAINLKEHKPLNEVLQKFAEEGKFIGAICAAPIVPGSLGLAKNKKVTCYPGFEDQLTEAEYTGNPTEVDGQLITGKAAGASMAFALQLVEILSGTEKAKEVADKMFVQ